MTAPAEAALPARTPRPAPSTEGPLRRVRKTGLRLRSLALPVAFTSPVLSGGGAESWASVSREATV